jgi:lysophospholipase L1-like esterase
VRLLQNLLLSVVSLALFLGAAEGLARLRYRPERIRYQGIFEYDRDKVYALKPNLADGRFVGRVVTTNSLGHRDREIPIAKPPNGFRVLAIGDSVTFGHGVDGEQTWPERLETRLAARHPALRVDVVNTAQPGNSPFQEYVDLERALRLAPDSVIVQFVLNDVVEPRRFLRRHGGKGIDYHGVEDVPYWDWLLSQRSASYLLLKDVAARIRFRTLTPDGVKAEAVRREKALMWHAAADEPGDPEMRDAWDECLAWMRREVELAKAHELPTTLIVTPVDFQFLDETRTYAQRRLAEFAARHGVTYVDLLVTLRARAVEEVVRRDPSTAGRDAADLVRSHPDVWRAVWSRYFLDHDHLTPAGHELVAETLAPRIEELAAARAVGLSPR